MIVAKGLVRVLSVWNHATRAVKVNGRDCVSEETKNDRREEKVVNVSWDRGSKTCNRASGVTL